MISIHKTIDNLMDAKYNAYLDSGALRISMIIVGFAAWFAGGVALLKFAA